MKNNLASSAAALNPLIDGCKLAAKGKLVREVADAAAKRGGELLVEMFADKIAPSGVPWLPPAHDYGHPLLRASGDLQASGTCTLGPRLDAGGFDLTFAFTDEKAPWQNFGTRRGGGSALRSPDGRPSGTRRKSGANGEQESYHIPARPLLPVVGDHGRWRDDLEAAGQRAAERWLTVNVRGA